MTREIRMNTTRMMCWSAKTWLLLLPATILIAVFIANSLCLQEQKEYEEEIKYLYTADELKELMTDSDYAGVERVMATDDLLTSRNAELSALRSEEPTEENLLRQAKLLQEINTINLLRSNFVTYFSTYQSRYYWMETGTKVTMREDIQKPTGLSGHIIAYSVVGAVGISIAAAVLFYLLAGFLHTKDELELNFGYDVYETSLKDGELLEKVRFLAKAEGLKDMGDLVVSGSVNWLKKPNSSVKEALVDEAKAVFLDEISETVACLEALNGKKVLLIERANNSKLRNIRDNDLVIRKAKAEVIGVIFLA